jgi:hypothetical protein
MQIRGADPARTNPYKYLARPRLRFADGLHAQFRSGLVEHGSARGGHDLELPVRSAGRVPMTGHDASVELIVTPDRGIDRRAARGPRPRGEIHWAD